MSESNDGVTPLSGDTVVGSGNTMDNQEHTVQAEQHSGNNIAQKYSEVLSGASTMGHSFVPPNQDENMSQAKEEMAFTVVAVDTDVSGHVQLSIIPTGPEAASKLGANAVELSATQNPALFNQLALIATNIESAASEQPHQTSDALAQTPQDEVQQEQLTPDVLTEPNTKTTPENTVDETLKETNSNKTDEKDIPDDKNSQKTRVQCSECEQDFSDLPSMRRHRLIHSDAKPYQCEFCEKAFRRKDNLREHRNIHTQENVYTCDRCGKTFPRKYTHKIHMAKFCTKERPDSDEKNDEENWEASENDVRTPDGKLVGKPVPKSTASGNTKCSDPCKICSKTFRDTSTLKRHMLTHSDERPFKCRQCEKSFRRKDHLMEHVIVHNVIRPFTCLQCGKSFSRKNGLKTHMIRSSHKDGHEAQVAIRAQLAIEDGGEEVSMAKKADVDFQLLLTANETLPEHLTNNEEQYSNNATNSNHALNERNEISVDPNSDHDSPITNADAPGSFPSDEVMDINGPSQKNTLDNSNVPENCDAMHPEKSGDTMVEDTFNESGISDNVLSEMECPNCQHMFPGKDALWSHFQEHLDDDQFACEFCLTTFTTAEQVKEHHITCIVSKDSADIAAREGKPNEDSQSEEMVDMGITADISSEVDETGETTLSQESDGTKSVVASAGKGQRMCDVCNKNFRDTTALKRHFLVHSGERPHACTRCDKRFRRRDHLKSHVTAYHCVTTTFQCKGCQMVFSTRYCLTTHTKTCKKGTPRQQSSSGETTKVSGTLESRTCPICNKVFKDPSSQRRHMRVHSDERPFQCELCPKSFRRKDNLKEHMLCHSNQKPFACEDCGKTLSRRSSLTNHRTICTKRTMDIRAIVTENALVPEEAAPQESDHLTAELTSEDEVVVQDQSMPQHQSIMDAEDLRDVQLLQSTQPLLTTESSPTTISLPTIQPGSGVTQELEPNHVDPNTEVELCDSSSEPLPSDINEPLEDAMEEDMTSGGDDEDKGFTCTLCGKLFRAKWTLKYHQRVHTGEKPYTCLTCDRQFRQPSHLKIHQRTHSGERPYVCDACGRAFIDSSTRRRHARVHKEGTADPSSLDDPGSTEESMEEQAVADTTPNQPTPLNENTTQPINANVVPTTSQPENANIVHLVGELATTEANQGEEIVLATNKIPSMGDVNWQSQNVGQMTYYIVPANKESPEKQGSLSNF